jgi:hypothetical protein
VHNKKLNPSQQQMVRLRCDALPAIRLRLAGHRAGLVPICSVLPY